VGGRSCGGGGGATERFKYKWQGGLVLIYNESDCPQFDAGDRAFIGRLVLPPMRSKFVHPSKLEADPADEDEFVFPKNPNIFERFPLWMSALADVLMEHYDPAALERLPPSFDEWRHGIASAPNKLTEWLHHSLVIIGGKGECVTLAELRGLYEEHTDRQVKMIAFDRLAKAYLEAVPGVSFKSRTTVKGVTVRNVFWGVRRA
jgi:hypothetical protein